MKTIFSDLPELLVEESIGKSSSSSVGCTIGIVIGTIIFVVLTIILCVLIFKKKKGRYPWSKTDTLSAEALSKITTTPTLQVEIKGNLSSTDVSTPPYTGLKKGYINHVYEGMVSQDKLAQSKKLHVQDNTKEEKIKKDSVFKITDELNSVLSTGRVGTILTKTPVHHNDYTYPDVVQATNSQSSKVVYTDVIDEPLYENKAFDTQENRKDNSYLSIDDHIYGNISAT